MVENPQTEGRQLLDAAEHFLADQRMALVLDAVIEQELSRIAAQQRIRQAGETDVMNQRRDLYPADLDLRHVRAFGQSSRQTSDLAAAGRALGQTLFKHPQQKLNSPQQTL